jgi:hypothetical protein
LFADYTFYVLTYGGSAIAEASFPLYGNRATAYLKSIMSDVPELPTEDMKMAMCAVSDEMFKDDSEHGGIQSENVDGYSISYKGDTRTARRKWYDTAMMFLSGSGLMGRWI